eukprot:TRINITY_DN854_c0_g1_i2.p1 TRINITY_DN854_c0_g1~~TRINITY_DN854_c0_g1_i2.p1  ORF type:complete len:1017 (+),score=208.66 TRINITY_DN854_c0_g1_i2:402-3452(+)
METCMIASSTLPTSSNLLSNSISKLSMHPTAAEHISSHSAFSSSHSSTSVPWTTWNLSKLRQVVPYNESWQRPLVQKPLRASSILPTCSSLKFQTLRSRLAGVCKAQTENNEGHPSSNGSTHSEHPSSVKGTVISKPAESSKLTSSTEDSQTELRISAGRATSSLSSSSPEAPVDASDSTSYDNGAFSEHSSSEDEKPRLRKVRRKKKVKVKTSDSIASENSPCTILDSVLEYRDHTSSAIAAITPPAGLQKDLRLDLTGLDIATLVQSDEVYNKELSWLAFNWRVLYMALDCRTPLFERLRFVAICARNLDEFFSKRVGALKRQEAAGLENLIADWKRWAWTPRKQLKMVASEVGAMVKTLLAVLLEDILPALEEEGVHLMQYEMLSEPQRKNLAKYFKTSLEPILTPLAVDPGHPFPFIGNMTLSIAVELRDPVDDGHDWAIVNVPSSCPRWRSLAFDEEDDNHLLNSFISIEQVIRANLGSLFGGMEILSANFFRVTRNADVARNEEEAEDLLEMINDEMRERKFAPFVRLEVENDMPDAMLEKLTRELGLVSQDDLYRVVGPLALGDLDLIPVKFGRATHLQYEPWVPLTHPRLLQGADIFEVIRSGDLLVHHPYHSFGTSTQAFLEAAAVDPKVRAIKATLYRTSAGSPIISALAQAAEYHKQVAVLVEVKARFDEARNVGFAQKLEDAGCNVAYGLVGLKTHCKCTMVVREEGEGFRTYVHIGTGNYNPRTAGVYTDFGLLSCNPELGEDVADLFKYLTGFHRQVSYNKLLVAPGTMRYKFLKLLDREIAHAQEGRPAGVVIKCNGLDDQVMVAKIYEAAAAGVKVDCIVRGMCRIRVGVPGISTNIRVISIIGRFLEHHRIFRFENGGNPLLFIGSADWMSRNLTRRVEVVTPVEDESIKKELQAILDACLVDKRTGWEMQPNGQYRLQQPPEEEDDGLDDDDTELPTPQLRRNEPRLIGAETHGLHQACMDYVARKARKAKKMTAKKKDGRPAHSRRMKESILAAGGA